MTTTIQISDDVSSAAADRVQQFLDETALRDPSWNGAEFILQRGDYTCIPDDDSPAADSLLNSVYRVIDGE